MQSFPLISIYSVLEESAALSVAKDWLVRNNLQIKHKLGTGKNGTAYLLSSGVVLKVTKSLAEAAFAYDSIDGCPEGYVEVYSVESAVCEEHTVFLITMDYVEQPEDFLLLADRLDSVLDRFDIYLTECPSIYKNYIESEELMELYWNVHYIVMENEESQFKMNDIHFENLGLDKDTGEVVVIDQAYNLHGSDWLADKYLEKINR